ncbi:methyltransferase domain-containing protein [Patescibacteria group bacterium]|nr:methyltransferase domain-containing protein [Patescibacteria group bacterium]
MEELVQHLKEVEVLKTPALVKAFLGIDRKDFVLPEYQNQAYEDYPLSIGFGQTISQPYTVAFMLELLQPKKGEKILDIGSGSAWTTALLAHAAGPKGKVYGTEVLPGLVRFGQENLSKYALLPAKVVQAKKETLGFPGQAPFDKILVSAVGKEIPRELLSQLKDDGVMVLPVQDAVVRIQKVPGKEPDIQRFEGFVFVPLI